MRFHRRHSLAPYLLLAPGLAWLAVFFAVPMFYLGYTSLQAGDILTGYTFQWAWDNYTDAFTLYRAHFLRSLQYAGVATLAALLISYPLAYWIAFRAGRWKSLFLLLVIAPFFVTYLIRTIAWKTMLADQGPVVGILRDLQLVSDDGRLLATTTAVVAGITYNYLPFMALPLYVSLEQIDRGLIEAAQDLYASRAKAFLRVTLPLSAPGIFAGTILTFIPAAGDFINAELLGTPRQQMIGNVIQSKFKEIADYPQAAALSFVLMATILLAVVAYARALGTERATAG
ncbi:MAG: ABC transporter permease [Actinomycetota bacterium]|nr:ABC transporter permease [Actinomycetota bacterium]